MPLDLDASEPSATEVTIVKLRLDLDYGDFAAIGPVDALDQLADALAIPVASIALLDVRQGCVIMVVALPKEAATRLLDGVHSGRDESFKALKRSLRIVSATEGDRVEAPSVLSRVTKGFRSDVSWLHISDLHIRGDYDDPLSDTRADLGIFLDDLPTQLADVGVVPDAVFVTGDVAQYGMAEEYESAAHFFADLIQRMPEDSGAAPLLIVPGNHDVDWSTIDPEREAELRHALSTGSSDAAIGQHWDYIEKRQRHFRDFLGRIRGMPTLNDVYFTATFPVAADGIRIGVSGLNSSWLSTRKDRLNGADPDIVPDFDLQYLRLGVRQLRGVAASPDLVNANLRIALVHHAPLSEWYAGEDRALQRQELTLYDFVLRGHQHEPFARFDATIAGTDDFVELAPGALRTQPHWKQGFMTTELDLRAGLVRLHSWTVTGRARRWVLDNEFGNRGSELRALPRKLRRRLSWGSTTSAAA